MTMMTPIEQAKGLAALIRQNWFWHYGQRFSFMVFEVVLYVFAFLLLALDLYIMSLGHRLLVAEAVNGHSTASMYVEDARITALLHVAYLLLFLFALACFLFARVFRGMRIRRNQVQALCEAVAKL